MSFIPKFFVHLGLVTEDDIKKKAVQAAQTYPELHETFTKPTVKISPPRGTNN